jgi:hypothetical protein
MNINHFYHIWADANWQDPLTDHLIALHDNGLYDQLNVFNIGIVGSLFNINQVKQYLQEHGGDKVSIVVEVENGVEQDTIDFMIDSDAAGYALYSSTNDIFQDNEYEHNFRKELNKVLIKDWEKCRILLNDYSIVGAYYLVPELKVSEVRLKNMVADELKNDDVKITRFTSHVELYDAGYFSSNFFWTHLKYLKALGKPERGTTSSDHYIKNVKVLKSSKL